MKRGDAAARNYMYFLALIKRIESLTRGDDEI